MEEQHAREMIMWTLSPRKEVKKLYNTSGGSSRYLFHVLIFLKLTRYDLKLSKIVYLYVWHVPAHLDAKRDRGVLMDERCRVGLTQSLEDDNIYEHISKEA